MLFNVKAVLLITMSFLLCFLLCLFKTTLFIFRAALLFTTLSSGLAEGNAAAGLLSQICGGAASAHLKQAPVRIPTLELRPPSTKATTTATTTQVCVCDCVHAYAFHHACGSFHKACQSDATNKTCANVTQQNLSKHYLTKHFN